MMPSRAKKCGGASLDCPSMEESVPDGGESARRRRLLDVESVTLAETILSELLELSDNDDDGEGSRRSSRTVRRGNAGKTMG